MDLLDIKDHNDLAKYFGSNYTKFGNYLYSVNDEYKYKTFSLNKKSGGKREINAPRRLLKMMQSKLSKDLYKVYPTRVPTHGFAQKRSIVTNAQRHLDKKYVFNIDLLDFFGCIHFGRIRNLFMSEPFKFTASVATPLAQLCCYKNSLPQGAPSSPILSNMICWKLDAQLQQLAKVTNATYTRYADDITFSFTCPKRRLPEEIVMIRDDEVAPGYVLSEIIHRNGFQINYDKVRLSGVNQRKEVTGIVVNEFPNVHRRFIRQIGSILHAWEKYGYNAAMSEFNQKYDMRQRASNAEKSLLYVVKGKLAFLRSVRGSRDPIFQKLAKRFNVLVEDESKKFVIVENTQPDQLAMNSLWVLEACYDDENCEVVAVQGTGFFLDSFGLVTCAHVVTHKGKLINPIEAYQSSDLNRRIKIKVLYLDMHRDLAICAFESQEKFKSIELSSVEIAQGMECRLFGFPAYKVGQSCSIFDTKITSTYIQSGVNKFEIGMQIREGNSGGPVVDIEGKVIGVALEGARKDMGTNAVLNYSELLNVYNEKYRV